MSQLTKPCFVVIDDSKTAIKIVEHSLKNCDIDIVSFNSAIEATPYLKDHQPDLIILDIIMPEKDGLTFLEEIRSQNHKDTSVVMMTSKDYSQDRLVGKQLGVLDFIIKPSTLEEIEKRLITACKTIIKHRDTPEHP